MVTRGHAKCIQLTGAYFCVLATVRTGDGSVVSLRRNTRGFDCKCILAQVVILLLLLGICMLDLQVFHTLALENAVDNTVANNLACKHVPKSRADVAFAASSGWRKGGLIAMIIFV